MEPKSPRTSATRRPVRPQEPMTMQPVTKPELHGFQWNSARIKALPPNGVEATTPPKTEYYATAVPESAGGLLVFPRSPRITQRTPRIADFAQGTDPASGPRGAPFRVRKCPLCAGLAKMPCKNYKKLGGPSCGRELEKCTMGASGAFPERSGPDRGGRHGIPSHEGCLIAVRPRSTKCSSAP